MKLLLLTQYFPPETGAPQNRLYELAVRLRRKGVDVTVLTAMPNYPQMEIYKGYEGKEYMYEEMEGLKIHRASIFVTKDRSIRKRLKNYFSFVRSSWKTGKSRLEKKYDYILCESPPLFLGITAWRLSRRLKAKMVFNVSDLWPESAEKLGLVKNRIFLGMATWLEEFLYRKSALVTGQTQGIVKNISGRFPKKKVYWLPNGADLSLFDPSKIVPADRAKFGLAKDDVVFFYGGIIGYAQGLEVILKAADLLRDLPRVKFLLLGDGPEKEKLLRMKEELKIANVVFHGNIPKSEMPLTVAMIDYAVLPLRRLELFKGAIPSKIFESLAMEKAVLLGVEGEAKELFIDDAKAGLFYIPEDHEDLASKVRLFMTDPEKTREMGKQGRSYVQKKFNRDHIAEGLFTFLSENM